MIRTSPLAVFVLFAALVLTSARAQLGTGDDAGAGAGAGASPAGAGSTPMTLPSLRDATYQFEFQGTPTHRRAPSHFNVQLDTPSFGNGSRMAWQCHPEGVCHGLCQLVLDWYTQIMLPVRLQTDWIGETTVSGRIGLMGTVTQANIEQYRLRAYTQVRDQKRECVRRAIHFQNTQSYIRPKWDVADPISGNHAHLVRKALGDIHNPARGVAPISVFGPEPTAEGEENFRHAVLIISAGEGFAVAPNGHRERVARLRIWDPNHIETDARAAEINARNYLMYFYSAEKLGFPAAYVNRYVETTGLPAIQTGPFMADDNLLYKNLHQGTDGREALEGSLIFRTVGVVSCRGDQLDWPAEDQAN